MTATTTGIRMAVCAFDDLTPELGVAALVGGIQVAIFRLSDDRLFAVQNLCPFSGAAVMSRGITGSRGEVPTIASPLHKQVFSLEDGSCLVDMDKAPLEGRSADLATYPVVVEDGQVVVEVGPHGGA